MVNWRKGLDIGVILLQEQTHNDRLGHGKQQQDQLGHGGQAGDDRHRRDRVQGREEGPRSRRLAQRLLHKVQILKIQTAVAFLVHHLCILPLIRPASQFYKIYARFLTESRHDHESFVLLPLLFLLALTQFRGLS